MPGAGAGPGLTNYLFASDDEPHDPDPAFARLRWGGQFIYCARSRRKVRETARRFTERGFEIIRGPAYVRRPVFGLSLPLLSRIASPTERTCRTLAPTPASSSISSNVT